MYFAAGNYACGGSVLDRHHVLTAQHCLYDAEGNLHDPAECFIVAGAHSIPGGGRRCGGQDESQDWEVAGVETFFMRSDYDSITHANDIAVLRSVPPSRGRLHQT